METRSTALSRQQDADTSRSRNRLTFSLFAFGLAAAVPAFAAPAASSETGLRAEVVAGLRKAAAYYHGKVAAHGGYLYYYSLDLKQRWGEGVGNADQNWVEPPGTPAVGRAYLLAYEATGDAAFLAAAKDAGHSLVYGQLKSGGWTQTIDFNPNGNHVAQYRNGKGRGRDHSSLDDNQTQSATQFLARLDKALGFKDAAIHDAVRYALDALLKAQFPNGGFPQGWKGPVAAHPVIKANYAPDWPRVWPNENYWDHYTLNDGLAGTVSDTLITAWEVYRDKRYLDALRRLGDFLILAQMPDPQPAWAQQYNAAMQPMWARKFEPPAISGLESEDVIRTLMKLARATGDRKYLEPIPRALAYLRTCVLPDGQMARYYELKTNRPLYMNRKPGVSGSSKAPGYYDLTYDDRNLPSHYGWKQKTGISALQKEFDSLQKGPIPAFILLQKFTPDGKLVWVETTEAAKPVDVAKLEKQVRGILAALDDEGRWVTVHDGQNRLVGQPKFAKGFAYLGSNVFNYNVEVLCRYLQATRQR